VRRFSHIGRNQASLVLKTVLGKKDTLQGHWSLEKLNHDTDLQDLTPHSRNTQEKDYRDELLQSGGGAYRVQRDGWGNRVSFTFRSRLLNYIFQEQSGQNYTDLRYAFQDGFHWGRGDPWVWRSKVELLSSYRVYRFEDQENPHSRVERRFRLEQGIGYVTADGDSLFLHMRQGYEDGGLYQRSRHTEFRSTVVREEFYGFKGLHRCWDGLLQGSLDYHLRLDYTLSENHDRQQSRLQQRLEQIIWHLEYRTAAGTILGVGLVWSHGYSVSRRLDPVYRIRWRRTW
jgi:hypothetical protein